MKGISDNSSSQPKRFWNFLNRQTSRSAIPDSVTIDGDKVFITPNTKAEAFNYYFASAFNIGRVLPTDIDTTPYLQNNISEIILNREEVPIALLKIDPSKTPGPDLIHPKILEECASELAPSLCALFNLSLGLGKLPLELKRSNVVPVFKNGDKSVISNYRPIHLLSIVSKLCQRCILDKLIPNLLELLSPKQHGFVPKKSCVTQLLTVPHDLGKPLDAGHESDVLYLDFSNAFDSVPHNLLQHKLSLYGIDGPLYSWFSDYLLS